MCTNCKGLGKTSNKIGKGLEWITPCSCLPDWETVRKPQLEKILKKARERHERYSKHCDQEYRREVPVSQAQ